MHLVLDLPMSDERRRDLASVAADGYEIVTWRRHCPDDLIEAYAEMRSQMNQDAPRGELVHEPRLAARTV